jgi:hypothetical protein
MTIQTATYRNVRIQSPTYAHTIAARVDTFSNTFRYRAEDGKVARLSPVSAKSLADITRKDQ